MGDITKKGNIMKISKSLQIVMWSTIALGLQSSGHAQGNLVNLYDWTPETMYGQSPNAGIDISSFNSAYFMGEYSTNVFSGPSHIVPILTGNLATTPGATYEISYTIGLNGSQDNNGGSLTFGSFDCGFSFTLPANSWPLYEPTENFDFLVTATSPNTTMIFNFGGIDNGMEIDVSNFSVAVVPEISAARLFGFLGCVLVLAQPWQRLFQKRKRN
jgi:hypothetical protein